MTSQTTDVMVPRRSARLARQDEITPQISSERYQILIGDGNFTGANVGSSVHYHFNAGRGSNEGGGLEKKRKRKRKKKKSEHDSDVDSGIKYLNDIVYFDQNAPISKAALVFEGGMKSETMPDEPVAVKLLPFISKEYAKPLIDEASAIKKIKHPNVVNYIHADMCGKYMWMYLVMEMCMKLNMHDHVKNMRREGKRFSLGDCKSTLKQLGSALKLLHQKNILHRDIKPSNILLSKDGRYLKLTDFSLAKPVRPERSVTADSSKRIGTDGWRAPEVLLRNEHTKKSDVYSLGLSLYFIWSNGEHAFGDDPDSVNRNIKMNVNRNLTKISFEEVGELSNLVEKMLEFEQRKRISTDLLDDDPLCTGAKNELANWRGEAYRRPTLHGGECKIPDSPSLVVFERTTYSLLAYEPSQKSWTPMQPLDSNMTGWNMTAVRADEFIYAFLENKRVFSIKYTDRNSIWEVQNDMRFEHGDLPPTAIIGGYIYAIGQSQPKTVDPRRGEKFDVANGAWSEIPEMETERVRHTVVACNGSVFSIGGIGLSVGSTAEARGEKFDPVKEKWSSIAPMNGPRFGASATALADKIYIFGGARPGRSNLKEAEVYDTKTNAWTRIAQLNVPRCYFGAATINGKIYAVDGHGIFPFSIEEYDPQKKKWEVIDEGANMIAWPSACVSI